jgi:hypothetical protein
MPSFKPPTQVVTPVEVLKLFLRGVDTVDIAAHYGIPEHEAYKLLRFAMEARRTFNDQNRDPISSEHEPSLEGH